MAYVDLNPIRAKTAKKPEESDFTSIQQRIHQTAKQCFLKDRPELVPFRQVISNAEERKNGLPLTEVAYLQLVDVTGPRSGERKKKAASFRPTPYRSLSAWVLMRKAG